MSTSQLEKANFIIPTKNIFNKFHADLKATMGKPIYNLFELA